MSRILVLVLAVDNTVNAELMVRLVESVKVMPDLQIGIVRERPVDRARNIAAETFMRSGCDWLTQIDSDTIPARGDFLTIVSLMERDGKKICALPAPMVGPFHDLVFNLGRLQPGGLITTTAKLPSGWSEWDVLGTPCLIVHRSVFGDVPMPWFRCMRDTFQLLKPEEERVYEGGLCEDYFFTDKAKKHGHRLWAHHDYVCGHVKSIDLTRLMQKMATLQQIRTQNLVGPTLV